MPPGDTAKLFRSIPPSVYKYGYYKAKDSTSYHGEAMSFQDMKNYTLKVQERRKTTPLPNGLLREVNILDILDQTACVKIKVWWGTDYLLMAKENNTWKIVSVIWQSPPKS